MSDIPTPLIAHTMLIGSVALYWNSCHEEVFRLFLVLSNLPRRMAEAIFFTLKADSAQRDITESIVRTELADHPDLKKTALELIRKLGRLGGERNAAIHTMWAVDIESRTFVPSPLVKHSGALNADFQTQFEKLSLDLTEINQALLHLTMDIQIRLSWRGIPPPRTPSQQASHSLDTESRNNPEPP